MQIAPISALEVSLATLNSGVMAQQQVDQASVGQNNMRASVVDQTRESDKAHATKAAADASDQMTTAQVQQTSAQTISSNSSEIAPSEKLTQRQLFDYLAEVERSSASYGTPPSALVQSALGALDGTLQKIGQTMAQAKMSDPASATEPAQASQAGSGSPVEDRLDSFARQAEQMIDRSMSVMWAAANLEIVMGSVSTVTSSTSTLIKQQ